MRARRVLFAAPNSRARAQVTNLKFANIGALACVACGLNRYYNIGVPLVDAVLEEVRGCERVERAPLLPLTYLIWCARAHADPRGA